MHMMGWGRGQLKKVQGIWLGRYMQLRKGTALTWWGGDGNDFHPRTGL